MTREENIRAILDTCFSESKDEIKEVALNNIMSLSAEPSGDLISREEVLALINKAMDNTDNKDIQDYIFCGLRRDVNNLPSAESVPQLKQTDTLIIADALRYLVKDTERHELDRTRAEELREQILQYGASMCSSAERQTVIRSKTLMPTKDFKEWAKRIREVNPNAVVIPCDAEVVSAEPRGIIACEEVDELDMLERMYTEQKWITDRKPKESGTYMVTLDAFGQHRFIKLMDYGKPLLPNKEVRGKCWYDSDDEYGDVVYDDKEIFAWMPLPKPYREDGEEEPCD